jgi:hypothetical protein
MTLQNCLPCPATFILFETSADERGGGVSRHKLPGLGGPEGGPEPEYSANIFVFLGSRLNKLTLSDQPQATL